MSSSSSPSGLGHARKLTRSLGDRRSNRLSRPVSRMIPKKEITYNEAYTYALRAAYLHHLLQPRPKKKQYISQPRPAVKRNSSMVDSAIKDFQSVTGSKGVKLPKDFMSHLLSRLQGVLAGKERMREYNERVIKQSIAEGFTALSEPSFRKTMEKDRRAEDLVLIFYANAVKALQKSKPAGDDSWKPLVDRHVALFVRLMTSIMKDGGWDRGHPELMMRLATLEKKLLTEDQDLASSSGPSDTFIEVTQPISYNVADMKLVQVVIKMFGLRNSSVQTDIDINKTFWTEETALTELKAYQQCLSSGSNRVLTTIDFDVEEAYQAWKKNENHDLAQMMRDITVVKPELMKSTSGNSKPLLPPKDKPLPAIRAVPSDGDYSNTINNPVDGTSLSSFSQSQPVDVSGLFLGEEHNSIYLEQVSFTYIPPDPRAYYKAMIKHASEYDQLHAENGADGQLLSKQSLELLTELAIRWRVPQFSRMILFLDATAQRYMDGDIGLKEVDMAFQFIENPPQETRKTSSLAHAGGLTNIDPAHWTIHDYATYRHTLSSLHDALLRELFDVMQESYGKFDKPKLGQILTIVKIYIESDPQFARNEHHMAEFTANLDRSLRERAAAVYRGYLEAEVPQDQNEWQFYHVIQLGKSVAKLVEKIQKRFKKQASEVMGVEPLQILVETIFPSFESDAADLIRRIMQVAHSKQEEVDLQDGFTLYKELVEIRNIHKQALPNMPFAFHIESDLADFVWRWIAITNLKMKDLIEQAILHDKFQVRAENPADHERHSTSVIDVFRIFTETTNQVKDLGWGDEVHHAKFMTALSKSYGIGLARYCEVVEKQFTAEMSRLTPEQEAEKNQTKQDRWMKMAKDAWANKEKPAPFQFYPESLVKLNNIEYAIQHLDKLERMMDVDACWEVLEKHITPQEKKRRPQKFVFTVKIVEAEDLKAMDTNGYSDPYVVLVDEFGKRLTKTRVINKNLNPRWDESFDIIVQGSINITAHIFDYDAFSDDDYIGRASLKLDPSHFSDYLPKECWLQLDTQGKLLLRIGMEGERDDIQFHFGKGFRMLKRTERDMVRKITDKLSTYINICLSHDALKSLLKPGMSVQSLTSMWKNRQSIVPAAVTKETITNALGPLLEYFDDNFAIMQQTLTQDSMIMVMTRLWKEVLIALESMLVPPLSDKPSAQKPLTQQEFDIVFKWLDMLYQFFNAKDEHTGEVQGVPVDVLKSPKYYELTNLAFFYFEPTENLIRTSERMASATAQRANQARNRLSAPPSLGPSLGVGGMMRAASTRRAKSIMLSRNLGTMKKAKEEKRREAQADPNDDMILRILRMRTEPFAASYLRDRSRQRERLAASAAAEMIVRQSLASGGQIGGFGRNNLPRR